MLHSKSQGHLVPEKIFKGFLPYMGMSAIMVTQMRWKNFCPPYPLKLHMKFGFDWPSDFRDVWTMDGWRDDNRWTMMEPAYKLTFEPKGFFFLLT